MANHGNCKFEGCDNDADYPILGVCRTCYSGLRYWRGRGLRDKRARLQQIVRLNSRMEYMVMGNDNARNVVPISKARRKRARRS